MLAALTRIDLGGGWETQGIGHWMRCAGVNALIFPSARCNVGVTIRNSELVDHYGWNLVDYRGAPPPISNEINDLSSWFTDVFVGVQYQVNTHPELLGSFVIKGTEEFHRDFFYARLKSFTGNQTSVLSNPG